MTSPALLLVEDNGDDEFLALRALAKAGITRVTVARDGCEALARLHASAGSGAPETVMPDAVLLDLQLPRIDGIELLRHIRSDERTSGLAVFILSSSEDAHERELCAKLGVSGFLPKPLNAEDVVSYFARLVSTGVAVASKP